MARKKQPKQAKQNQSAVAAPAEDAPAQRHRRARVGTLGALLLIAAVLGAGAFIYCKVLRRPREVQPPRTVAKIGTRPILREVWEPRLSEALEREFNHAVASRHEVMLALLDDMVLHWMILEAAHKRGLMPTDEEVQARADALIDDVIRREFPDRKKLEQDLERTGKTMEDLRAKVRADVLPDDDGLRELLAPSKLQAWVESRVTVAPEDVRQWFTYVKYNDLRVELKPESDRRRDSPAVRRELMAETLDLRRRLSSANSFADLELMPLSNKQFRHVVVPDQTARIVDLPPELAEAIARLSVGNASEPVYSGDTAHLIELVERREDLPADWAARQDVYRRRVLQKKRQAALAAYRERLVEEGHNLLTVYDPELALYRMIDEGRPAKTIRKATQKLVRQLPDNASVLLLRARQLRSEARQQPSKAPRRYQEAFKLLQHALELAPDSPELHLEAARILVAVAQDDEARSHLDAACRLADESARPPTADHFSRRDLSIHLQAKSLFKELGDSQREAAQQAWISQWTTKYASRFIQRPESILDSDTP